MTFLLQVVAVAFTGFLLAKNLVASEYLDYDQLDHTIRIQSLRAGNHDKSGYNRYYFKVDLLSFHNTAEERQKDLDDRQSEVVELGEFGDVELASLSYWRASEQKQLTASLLISGSSLREMTSKAMRTFNAAEQEVGHYIRIAMFEREKRFKFFGEDQFIGQTGYYPLPLTTHDFSAHSNRDLILTDALGTEVKFEVLFTHPEKHSAASARN